MTKKRKPLRNKEEKLKETKTPKIKGNHSKISSNEEDEWERIESSDLATNNLHDNDQDESDDESEDDGEDEIRLDGQVDINKIENADDNYTFEFNDIVGKYTESLVLLMKMFINNPTTAFKVSEAITNQSTVGTLVTCEDGTDAFAFASILPLNINTLQGPLQTFLQPFLDAISSLTSLNSIKSTSSLQTIQQSLSSGMVGCFIHNRFTNLPLQLIGPLHQNLLEDLRWASSFNESNQKIDEEIDQKSIEFFKNIKYVMLLATCTLSNHYLPSSKRIIQEKSFQVEEVVHQSSGILFDLFENEVFFHHSSASVLFKSTSSNSSLIHSNIVVMFLSINQLKECVKEIQNFI